MKTVRMIVFWWIVIAISNWLTTRSAQATLAQLLLVTLLLGLGAIVNVALYWRPAARPRHIDDGHEVSLDALVDRATRASSIITDRHDTAATHARDSLSARARVVLFL
jgi:hypothetical protein